MANDETRWITDVKALKVFTHPLRIKLYRALHASRKATASQLAEQVDEAVSLVSYHLRKLAEHGFIVEAPDESSDARERWWQPSSERGVSVRSSDFAGQPEGAALMSEMNRQMLATRYERYSRYLDQHGAWPQAWEDVAFSSEYLVRLTSEEMRQLGEERDALTRRWQDRGRAADDAGDTEGREHVALHMYGFPFRD
jgi:DNA-binding transcriptional ArsR family regulator